MYNVFIKYSSLEAQLFAPCYSKHSARETIKWLMAEHPEAIVWAEDGDGNEVEI